MLAVWLLPDFSDSGTDLECLYRDFLTLPKTAFSEKSVYNALLLNLPSIDSVSILF